MRISAIATAVTILMGTHATVSTVSQPDANRYAPLLHFAQYGPRPPPYYEPRRDYNAPYGGPQGDYVRPEDRRSNERRGWELRGRYRYERGPWRPY
jgi:hypothetical protein